MILQEATEVTVGGYKYYIRPFPAFYAARISGDIIKVVVPILGAVVPYMNASSDVLDQDISTLSPAIAKGFESLSGEACEKLLRELLINGGAVAVDYNNETVKLTEDIANNVFCGEMQDMYILAYHVIKRNYGVFFKKLGDRSGNVAEAVKGLVK